MAVETSIVVVNHDQSKSLARTLAALEMEQVLTCEVIVVDNASSDDSVEMVRRQFPWARVVEMQRNSGFAAAANEGMAHALGNVAIFCHSDIVASAHTMTELSDRVREGAAGRTAVALPRLVSPELTALPFVGRLPGAGLGTVGLFSPVQARRVEEPMLDHVQDHQWTLLVCAAFDCELLYKLGGFDARFIRYYHDADICQRLHDRSYRICIQRELAVIHSGGAGEAAATPDLQRLMRIDQKHYFEKHRPVWEQKLLRMGEIGLRWLRKDAV